MLESNKYVSFQADEQAAFMKSAFDKKKFDVEQLAKRFGVGSRTVRDWRRGKYKLPFRVLTEISRLAKVPIPDNVVTIDRVEHLRSVGAKGGAAVLAKYGHIGGDTQKRKDAWKRWWEKHGRHQESKILYKRKKIKYPRKSVRLAEFVGILMGDGGITARQVIITLHSENDKEFAEYYAGLCEILFGIRPSITKIKSCNAVNVVISRTDLVEWCHGLGLPIGHKIRQGLDIPDWIKKNPHYSRTCLRGLVDTDGSVFIHRYRLGRKEYRYKKLDFCSLSPALLRSAYAIFRANGMKPYVRPGKILRLENQEDVERYFRVIGSSNPKHLRRYKE